MKRILQRLKTEQGFSLTELLVTILIMGFVGVMITTGAATVQRVYRKVIAHSNAQSALSTTASLIKDQLAFADPESGITTGRDGSSITFKNLNSGDQTITLYPGSEDVNKDAQGNTEKDGGITSLNEEAGTGTNTTKTQRGFYLVYTTDSGSTTVPLLSDSAITTDLCVSFGEKGGFSYDPSKKTITVNNLTVQDLKTDSSVQASVSFTIRLLNS